MQPGQFLINKDGEKRKILNINGYENHPSILCTRSMDFKKFVRS